MSDFAFFSALNFCKDHAFFRYKKTNEKTLIKKPDDDILFTFLFRCLFLRNNMRFRGRNLWTYAKIFCKLCFLRENSIYNKLLEKYLA